MSVQQAPAEISAAMQAVADYIVHAADTPLPDQVTEKTKHHLLDTLAAMVSGSRLPPGIAALEYIKAQGGTKEASVPGSRIVTTVVNAALAMAEREQSSGTAASEMSQLRCITLASCGKSSITVSAHQGMTTASALRTDRFGLALAAPPAITGAPSLKDRAMSLMEAIIGDKGGSEQDPKFPHAPPEWTLALAVQAARQEGLELGEDRWEALRALQEYYARHEDITINMRELHDALDEKFHRQGGFHTRRRRK